MSHFLVKTYVAYCTFFVAFFLLSPKWYKYLLVNSAKNLGSYVIQLSGFQLQLDQKKRLFFFYLHTMGKNMVYLGPRGVLQCGFYVIEKPLTPGFHRLYAFQGILTSNPP